ncbi:MAG: hypothetical protein AAFQ81_18240, partial [Pseudomonadota bacterium]
RVAAQGVQQVFVLGDPGYYKRFGFRAETAVATPFPMPEDWAAGWQSLTLPGCAPLPAGTLLVPAPWREGGGHGLFGTEAEALVVAGVAEHEDLLDPQRRHAL